METTPVNKLAVGLALIAAGLSVAGFARIVSNEAAFFSAHTRQESRILIIPRELTAVEKQITQEQHELLRAQNEIRRRLNAH